MNSRVLPESYLKCLTPEQRKDIGQMSAEEALAKAEIKNERDLQKQVISYLRLKGIEVNVSRMDKRKTDAVGWADVTFSVMVDRYGTEAPVVYPCLFECKFGDGKLSIAQQQSHIRLSKPPNFWLIRVIRSLDDCIAALKEMGIQ